MRNCILITFIFAFNIYCFSQSNTKKFPEINILSDSIKIDSSKNKTDFKKFRMHKSPWGAVLRSAIVPGFGQFYNESYWKIPVIVGLMSYLGYEMIDKNKQYHTYRDQYILTQTTANPEGDDNLKTLRNFYRDQRDEFIWYLSLTYVVNLIDAYIDAHLFDFDVKEDNMINGNLMPRFNLKFKLRF